MNILLSSVGRRDYLIKYFQKALRGRGKVIAANCILDTSGMGVADFAELVPVGWDSRYVEQMLSVCIKHDVKMLFSLHDWEAPYIAKNKTKFQDAGVTIVMPELDIIEACLDKLKTIEFMGKIGVRCPKTFESIKDVMAALKTGKVDFPLIVKPRFGQGSIGLHVVYDPDELRAAIFLLSNHLDRSDLIRLPGFVESNGLIVQEFIKGIEFGVDIVNDLEGKYQCCFIKEKLAMRAGETDAAITREYPEIEKLAQYIGKATKHPGLIDADFFVSENNNIYLLELNPRFGGGYPFSHTAGADIPAALISWYLCEPPDAEFLRIKIGIKSQKSLSIAVET